MRRFRSKEAFAACVARGMTMSAAARACGIDRTTAYAWLKTDPEFRAMIDDAHEQWCDFAESKLYRLIEAEYFPAIAYLLSHRRSEIYGKVRVAVGGDTDAPPIGVGHRVSALGTVNNVQIIRMPSNRRDEPAEEIDADETLPLIEGEAPTGTDGG